MKYSLTGSCPRCGAPIFATQKVRTDDPAKLDGLNLTEPPKAHFTCECRQFLPNIPAGDIDQPRSVSEGDTKFVTDSRAAEREQARRG